MSFEPTTTRFATSEYVMSRLTPASAICRSAFASVPVYSEVSASASIRCATRARFRSSCRDRYQLRFPTPILSS